MLTVIMVQGEQQFYQLVEQPQELIPEIKMTEHFIHVPYMYHTCTIHVPYMYRISSYKRPCRLWNFFFRAHIRLLLLIIGVSSRFETHLDTSNASS